MKISRDSVQVRMRAAGIPGILLKSQGTDSLTHKHSSKLQRKGSGSKVDWVILGGILNCLASE